MFRRRRKDSDFSAEVEAHLQIEADRLEQSGLSREQAQAAARRRFGNVTAATERFYESGHSMAWDRLKQDLRFALRLMAKNPVVTAAIIATLALGIGANSLVFSVVRAVILKPLDYENPERIVQVWEHGLRSGGESDWVSFPNFRDWHRQNRVFEHMAAYRYGLFTMTGAEGAESVLGLEATDRLFAVLGVEAMLGRTFLPGHDKPGAPGVAVISSSLWERRFASDPAIAGKSVNIDGKAYSIAGLLIRSFVHVTGLDPGFRPARVLSVLVNLPPAGYSEPARQAAFFDELLRRVRALPGVESAAISNSVPLTGMNDQGSIRIEGRPDPAPGEDGPLANRPHVSSGYFETMGIPLVEGRFFDEHDRTGSSDVVIVSELAARTYWPGRNPLGQRVGVYRNGWVWRQIVGVVRSTRHFGIEAPQKPEVYLPHTQDPSPFMVLVVRARGEQSGLIEALRHEVAVIDPQQALFGFQTMEELVTSAGARRRFQTSLLAAFAALALLLAAIGVYGVTSYTVAQRTREIGLRLALGARPRDVTTMMLNKAC
jgi:hypothetical protein